MAIPNKEEATRFLSNYLEGLLALCPDEDEESLTAYVIKVLRIAMCHRATGQIPSEKVLFLYHDAGKLARRFLRLIHEELPGAMEDWAKPADTNRLNPEQILAGIMAVAIEEFDAQLAMVAA